MTLPSLTDLARDWRPLEPGEPIQYGDVYEYAGRTWKAFYLSPYDPLNHCQHFRRRHEDTTGGRP